MFASLVPTTLMSAFVNVMNGMFVVHELPFEMFSRQEQENCEFAQRNIAGDDLCSNSDICRCHAATARQLVLHYRRRRNEIAAEIFGNQN